MLVFIIVILRQFLLLEIITKVRQDGTALSCRSLQSCILPRKIKNNLIEKQICIGLLDVLVLVMFVLNVLVKAVAFCLALWCCYRLICALIVVFVIQTKIR